VKRVVVALVATIVLVLPAIAPGTHPRPTGATPIRASLVPAYEPCTAPDRTHGPPLAFGSCSGPQDISDYLTVGTPDANGYGAKSVGYFRIVAKPGTPGLPTDNKVSFWVVITDVRCKGVSAGCSAPGEDYTGTVEAQVTVQITDHGSNTEPGGGIDPATVEPVTVRTPVWCAATADPAIGGKCEGGFGYIEALGITLNDGQRHLWELGRLQVWDGGADGDGETAADNTLFAIQGLFVP
jgi:hypothetical protein